MAGGLSSTTSEVLRLSDNLLDNAETWNPDIVTDFGIWQMGPDVGEARYGLRLASMTTENEVVMVGGISHSTDEVFSTMKVLNASLQWWTDDTYISPVYDAIVLPVPKKILKGCNFYEPNW